MADEENPAMLAFKPRFDLLHEVVKYVLCTLMNVVNIFSFSRGIVYGAPIRVDLGEIVLQSMGRERPRMKTRSRFDW